MNSPLGYIHVNLEELTLVNFFQDYSDINETEIWPSLVGEIGRERVGVFFLPFKCVWAELGSHTAQLISTEAPAEAAEKPICLTSMKHKPDTPSHFRESRFKGSFFLWETEAGHAVSLLRAAVWIQHVFFTSVFTMLRFSIALVT